MIYDAWLNEWLEHFVKPTSKKRTYDRYRQLATGIGRRFGNVEINDLSPLLLQRYVTELLETGNRRTGKGLSPNTVNGVISIIQSSLKTAAAVGVADHYIAGEIKRPKVMEKPVECFSLPEQKAIETAVLNGKKPKLLGIVLCLYSGLRIGELLALEWSDVDLTKGVLSVTKSCHYGHGQNGFERFVERPKTATSERLIPIPKQLLPILKQHKKAVQSEYVISDKRKPVAVRSYQRSFELLQKRLHIRRRGFHALRHTFATRALECGMDVKTLSEILGYKNPTVTLNRYTHSLLEHKTEMMNRIGKLL